MFRSLRMWNFRTFQWLDAEILAKNLKNKLKMAVFPHFWPPKIFFLKIGLSSSESFVVPLLRAKFLRISMTRTTQSLWWLTNYFSVVELRLGIWELYGWTGLFIQKSGSVTLHHLSMSNFMQRIRKIITAVLREKWLLTDKTDPE